MPTPTAGKAILHFSTRQRGYRTNCDDIHAVSLAENVASLPAGNLRHFYLRALREFHVSWSERPVGKGVQVRLPYENFVLRVPRCHGSSQRISDTTVLPHLLFLRFPLRSSHTAPTIISVTTTVGWPFLCSGPLDSGIEGLYLFASNCRTARRIRPSSSQWAGDRVHPTPGEST